jgi:hypothetical protein
VRATRAALVPELVPALEPARAPSPAASPKSPGNSSTLAKRLWPSDGNLWITRSRQTCLWMKPVHPHARAESQRRWPVTRVMAAAQDAGAAQDVSAAQDAAAAQDVAAAQSAAAAQEEVAGAEDVATPEDTVCCGRPETGQASSACIERSGPIPATPAPNVGGPTNRYAKCSGANPGPPLCANAGGEPCHPPCVKWQPATPASGRARNAAGNPWQPRRLTQCHNAAGDPRRPPCVQSSRRSPPTQPCAERSGATRSARRADPPCPEASGQPRSPVPRAAINQRRLCPSEPKQGQRVGRRLPRFLTTRGSRVARASATSRS